MKLKKGLVQIYTGEGKGKTTAAIGLAIRALGAGLKVVCFQFLKSRPTGELNVIGGLSPDFKIERDGKENFCFGNSDPGDTKKTQNFFKRATETINSGLYDLVILDELNVAVHLKMIDLTDVLKLICDKPEHVELILTGRNAPKELIDAADLVTEMAKIKHPFDVGVKARKGIEE